MIVHRTYITTGERIRTYLWIAFALSLLINAFSSLVLPDIRVHHEDAPPDIFHITHIRPSVVHTPRPTPPPTPAPHQPTRAVSKPFAAAVPHTRTISRGAPIAPAYVPPKDGTTNGAGPGDATSAPVETALPASAAPSCSNPNQDATVSNAVSPDYPDSARELNLGAVSVLVQVTLDANGTLLNAKLAQSSNNAAIDQAALRAARESTYVPRIADCRPAAGTYIFRADFNP